MPYALKAVEKAGISLDVELWRGISIPIVAVLAWGGLRLIRKRLDRATD